MPESNPSTDLRTKLVKYAANILSRRPYFRHQLKNKLHLYLEKNNLSSDSLVVDQIITDLSKSGYLDDNYLAAAFVRRQIQKCYGPQIIRLKLRQLGLSENQVSQALKSEINDEVLSQTIEKIRLKYRCKDSWELKKKLYQRGFSGVQSIH